MIGQLGQLSGLRVIESIHLLAPPRASRRRQDKRRNKRIQAKRRLREKRYTWVPSTDVIMLRRDVVMIHPQTLRRLRTQMAENVNNEFERTYMEIIT